MYTCIWCLVSLSAIRGNEGTDLRVDYRETQSRGYASVAVSLLFYFFFAVFVKTGRRRANVKQPNQ